MDMNDIMPNRLVIERYWYNIMRYYLTQSYIEYWIGGIMNKMAIAYYGTPALYSAKYTDLNA